jgi:hypothetical protein
LLKKQKGYKISNLVTCIACQARQAKLRTGRNTGKLTKENYDATNQTSTTFEEASASYGDAATAKA